MKTTLTEFIDYLEGLASAHTDIAHDAEHHPAFMRFYESRDPEKAFKSKVENLPMVMVKDYDFKFSESDSDNLHKVREVEFLVVDKLGRFTKTEDVYNIWERTEEIGDEFIMRIKKDKRNSDIKAVVSVDINHIGGVPVDIGGNYFATSYTVPVGSVRSNDVDEDKWSDL